MAVYMIFYQDEITDQNALNAYQQAAGPTLGGTGVIPRVVSMNAENIEGDWNPVRVVMLEFPTKEAALGWYNSPAYTEVRKQRLGATRGAGILVEGLG